jgi:hypothetical protein
VRDLDDPVVKFKTDLSYGCSLPFTKDLFEKFCKDTAGSKTKILELEIFKNLEGLVRFGKFGNANILHAGEWKAVKPDDSFSKLGEVAWDDTDKTCTVYNSVQIKVVYHDMGYDDHPQRYIIEMKKLAKPEVWEWPEQIAIPTKRTIDFDFFVSV